MFDDHWRKFKRLADAANEVMVEIESRGGRLAQRLSIFLREWRSSDRKRRRKELFRQAREIGIAMHEGEAALRRVLRREVRAARIARLRFLRGVTALTAEAGAFGRLGRRLAQILEEDRKLLERFPDMACSRLRRRFKDLSGWSSPAVR